MMPDDATPLVEALLEIIDTARAYLPPDGIGKDAFIARVLEATDNPRIIAAIEYVMAVEDVQRVPAARAYLENLLASPLLR
jgi:hypothetical protein